MGLASMSIGPAVAIPAAVEMAGLTTGDTDVYELIRQLPTRYVHVTSHRALQAR